MRRSIHKPRELARRHSDGDQKQLEAMSASKAMVAEVDNTQRSLEEDFRRAAAAEEQPEPPMEDDPGSCPQRRSRSSPSQHYHHGWRTWSINWMAASAAWKP